MSVEGKPTSSENRELIAGLRRYYEEEIEMMVREMKIEGGTLVDCVAELRKLAEFISSQADGLSDAWPNLLQETAYEDWEQSQNETGAADAPRL